MNLVCIIGRLVRDVELRYSSQGTAIANFSIAVTEKYKDKESVHFFNVETWKKQAENCNQYLTKGSKVGITGSLKQSRWQDQSGANRSRVSINAQRVEFLSTKPREAKDTEEGLGLDE